MAVAPIRPLETEGAPDLLREHNALRLALWRMVLVLSAGGVPSDSEIERAGFLIARTTH